jgi:hypothetical protein
LRAERSNPDSDAAPQGNGSIWIAGSPAAPRNDEGGGCLSYDEQSDLSGSERFGCAIVALIGIIATFVGLIAQMDDCVPAPGGTGCESVRWIKLMWFPGIPLLFLCIGFGMIAFFKRDKN